MSDLIDLILRLFFSAIFLAIGIYRYKMLITGYVKVEAISVDWRWVSPLGYLGTFRFMWNGQEVVAKQKSEDKGGWSWSGYNRNWWAPAINKRVKIYVNVDDIEKIYFPKERWFYAFFNLFFIVIMIHSVVRYFFPTLLPF